MDSGTDDRTRQTAASGKFGHKSLSESRPERARAAQARRRWAPISPLTLRILTLNVLALAVLVGGLLYLGPYREGLIDAEIEALMVQGEIFSGALGEGAVGTGSGGEQLLLPDLSPSMLRRLVKPTRSRARLFAAHGGLVADSRFLMGPGGAVQIGVLPPLGEEGALSRLVIAIYDFVTEPFSYRRNLPPYREWPVQRAENYKEVLKALDGEKSGVVRALGSGTAIISVAVPVQRFKQVLGALLLTTTTAEIERTVREVRLDILKIFAVVLVGTALMSVYLAGTIARPVRRLAASAEGVRRGQGKPQLIPDLTARNDEIGDLSGALRDMTDALWQRMNAIESFAADVAHEIKNPLTSLRSAVETAARIEDPEQQTRLMAIIVEDVQRLDRLITDISDASRLDAELSRAEMDTVDLGAILWALVEIHRTTATSDQVRLRLEIASDDRLDINGIEDRLVEVFQNLIANAASFSPPGGTITIMAARTDGKVDVTVDDEGPGIPDRSFETIFTRFYSERPEGEKFGTHSGLGLSISKQIVEVHGGVITAANRRDERGRVTGARFTVRLPAA